MPLSLRRLLIGDPLRTEQAQHQKLSNFVALPVFASDALSSVAFATEEIMAALLMAGAVPYFGLTPWLSLGIVVLLVDYILNAAVCASAGAAAITSLGQNYGVDWNRYTVPIAIFFVVFIALVNLRGVRESAAIFAVPVYGFVAIMFVLILCGLYRYYTGALQPAHGLSELRAARVGMEHGGAAGLAPFGIFLLLHAFASGCTALTGVEAISNGVSAFKEPAPKNASTTMVWMALLLALLFIGLSFLAAHTGTIPPNAQGYSETVISQTGRAVFGGGTLYWILQVATCGILILSANTSFADFPRLSSLMARDGFLPGQLGNIGDKLVFDRGILVLAGASGFLVILFRGSVHALIPLFAIGVFLSFTLSQAGMVKRWATLRTPGWTGKALVNGVGAAATCVVTIVFGVVKFSHGAWVIVFLIPALVVLFSGIKRHYVSVVRQLDVASYRPRQGVRHHVLILVPDIHRGVLAALQYARSISDDARALHVAIDPDREKRLSLQWTLYSRGVPLSIVPSPYRSLATPVLGYIARLQQQEPHCLITVVIPEALAANWWTSLLHGQSSFVLLWRLRFQPGVVATHVPYHLKGLVDEPPWQEDREAL